MTTHNTTSQNDFRVLPATEPQSDPVGLWKLQVELLSWAEQLYGPRDASWRIDPPQCAKNIPHVDFAVGRGAFARLAPNTQRHWRFAVFQLVVVPKCWTHSGESILVFQQGEQPPWESRASSARSSRHK